MSNQDAVNAFLSQLNINNNSTSSSNKNKKKKTSGKKETNPDTEIPQVSQNSQILQQVNQVDESIDLIPGSNPKDKAKEKKPKPMSTMAKLALQHKKRVEEEEFRIKALQEEEERKIKEEEDRLEAERKKVEEERERKKQKEINKVQAQKDAGTYKTKKQKEKEHFDKIKLDQILKLKNTPNTIIIPGSGSKSNPETKINPYGIPEPKYKSIISCIMGHVDTGKTSLLDKVRDTNVQKGEVGGITQQIGATFIPRDTLINKCSSFEQFNIQIPGLLMIDTPGHEAFTNLRTMGSSICDIAVLVIDLVHGLEPQTIESMKMLHDSNTPFIIALNKIDRLYGWKKHPNTSFQTTFELQDSNTQDEFDTRLTKIIVQIMEQGFNAKLYWENDSCNDTISICPTSAITGEGLSDLLSTLIIWSQNRLQDKITYSSDLKCILMETTKVDGFGLTIDAILVNGELKVGDGITIKTLGGLFQTQIRSLLIPPANRESRVKTEFIHCQTVKGSIGIKIVVNGLENTGIPGSHIITTREFALSKESNDIDSSLFKLQYSGVTVHSSTMGSLEALIKFLQTECNPPIPICNINIGKVMKKDVIKASIINEKTLPEFKTILAFNVDVDEEAEQEASSIKVKIFKAEIIYHLFDAYTKYKNDLFLQRKEAVKDKMSYPCVLKIVPTCIFNKKNPLIFGVEVIEGNLHIGTHISDPVTNTYIGKVTSIQNNHKDVEIGKKSTSVCIKVDNQENPTIAYGRQFDHTNILYSRISRESLDVLKEYYRQDCSKDDLTLLVKLKSLFKIN